MECIYVLLMKFELCSTSKVVKSNEILTTVTHPVAILITSNDLLSIKMQIYS